MSERVLLYAGGGGGKSTFIGGLMQHLYDDPNTTVTYEVQPGNVWTFEEAIIGPMMEANNYPEATEQPYVATLKITIDSMHRTDTTVSIADAPGRWYDGSMLFRASDRRGDVAGPQMGPSIEEKLSNPDPQLTAAEGGQFLREQYKAADRVIFLLNLPQLISDDDEGTLAFDLSLIERTANEKDCAVVALGTDKIDYELDVDEHDENEWLKLAKDAVGISGEHFVDTQLIEAVESAVPRAGNLQVHNITNGIRSGIKADFFGVAVPSDNGGIRAGEDGCMTLGFHQVVDWLVPVTSPISELPIGRGD